MHRDLLFGSGSGSGFGGAFAKQMAAFTAGVTYSDKVLSSASLADSPARWHTLEAHCGAHQKRKRVHPIHQAAL